MLEIGYARGGLLDHLDAAAVEKFAVDIHERTVEPETTFFRHDCNEAFDFAAGRTFDIVFAGEVIEHIYDDARFLREIHRILSPGGVLSLTTPNLFFLVNRIVLPFGRMPYFAYAPFHYHFYAGTRYGHDEIELSSHGSGDGAQAGRGHPSRPFAAGADGFPLPGGVGSGDARRREPREPLHARLGGGRAARIGLGIGAAAVVAATSPSWR